MLLLSSSISSLIGEFTNYEDRPGATTAAMYTYVTYLNATESCSGSPEVPSHLIDIHSATPRHYYIMRSSMLYVVEVNHISMHVIFGCKIETVGVEAGISN